MAIDPSPELDHISRRVAAEKGMDEGARLELLDSYLDFLRFAAGSREAVFPTHAVDEIWHRHILHTHSYAQDCARWFGTFIHHQPASVPDETSQAILADCSAQDPVPCTAIGERLAECSAPEPEPPCRGISATHVR